MIKRLACIIVAVTLSAPMTLAAHAASSPKGFKPYLQVVGGSSKYLVYGRVTSATDGKLHVVNSAGKHRSLGHYLVQGPNALEYSLVGSTLIGFTRDAGPGFDPSLVHWWNLAHHTSGTVTIPDGGVVSSGAAGGILFQTFDEPDPNDQSTWTNTASFESLDGVTSVIGNPFGVHDTTFDVLGAPNGVVAIDLTGLTAAMKFAPYGSTDFADLAGGGSYDEEDTFICYGASKTLVTCYKSLTDGNPRSGVVVPLNGKKTIDFKYDHPVAVGKRVVYGSPTLHFRDADGTVKKSSVHGRPLVSGFGDLIFQRPSSWQKILSLAGPHAKPKVLVSIH